MVSLSVPANEFQSSPSLSHVQVSQTQGQSAEQEEGRGGPGVSRPSPHGALGGFARQRIVLSWVSCQGEPASWSFGNSPEHGCCEESELAWLRGAWPEVAGVGFRLPLARSNLILLEEEGGSRLRCPTVSDWAVEHQSDGLLGPRCYCADLCPGVRQSLTSALL